MARIHRRGHRRAEIDVAQTQHQVTRAEHDLAHFIDGIEAIDPADELDVARTPGRVLAHRRHVLLDREPGRWIVPGQRQMHDARGHLHVFDRRQLRFGVDAADPVAAQAATGDRRSESAANGCRASDRRCPAAVLLQPAISACTRKRRFRSSIERAVLDQQILVAGLAIYDLGPRAAPRAGAGSAIGHRGASVRAASRPHVLRQGGAASRSRARPRPPSAQPTA